MALKRGDETPAARLASELLGEPVAGMLQFADTGRSQDWELRAYWVDQPDQALSAGPDMIVIYPGKDASPEARSRGINSGVLRSMERALAATIQKLEEELEQEAAADLRHEVDTFLKAHPEPPRKGGDDYYRDLGEMWSGIKDYRGALELVAEMFGVHVETMRSRIKRAERVLNDVVNFDNVSSESS